ncbi:cohesin domain-containing protein [Herbiconiux liangxiaofengii]|uniref:cohesin domain-containing protein n=1 Tax=Herbiconiux liangxiaofengii TaxID=3342795 RepID=UPI0035B7A4F4
MHESAPRLRRLRTAALAGGVALGLTLLGASPALAAPTAGPVVITATPAVGIGDTIDVSIALPATTDVYAYEIDLAVDPAAVDVVPDSSTGPAGGFDSLDTDDSDGVVTLLHTRLGSSPAISGDLTAGLQLTAVASGSTSLVATVTLVDAAGARTTVTALAPAPVVIAPAPVPTPTPTPTPTATPTPTPTPSATSTPAAAVPADDGSLARTGQSVTGVAVIALVALLALGAGLLVVLRRRTAGTR